MFTKQFWRPSRIISYQFQLRLVFKWWSGLGSSCLRWAHGKHTWLFSPSLNKVVRFCSLGAEATCPTMHEGSRGSLPCGKCKIRSDCAANMPYNWPILQSYHPPTRTHSSIYLYELASTMHGAHNSWGMACFSSDFSQVLQAYHIHILNEMSLKIFQRISFHFLVFDKFDYYSLDAQHLSIELKHWIPQPQFKTTFTSTVSSWECPTWASQNLKP